jgi:hypothetical protein
VAILFCIGTAVAQAPPSYDPATETKVKGAVSELKFTAAAKPVALLIVKSGSDTLQVFLCPKSFLDSMGTTFKADEKVEIIGSKVKQNGEDVILAREVDKGDDVLTLRFKDGKPAW